MDYMKMTFIGRLGRAPEGREINNGNSYVCNMNVATTRRYTKADGTQVEETLWVRTSAWGNLGKACAQHLVKGQEVLIETDQIRHLEDGTLPVYQSNDGTYKASLEVRASKITFGSKPRSANGNGNVAPEADAGATTPDEVPGW